MPLEYEAALRGHITAKLKAETALFPIEKLPDYSGEDAKLKFEHAAKLELRDDTMREVRHKLAKDIFKSLELNAPLMRDKLMKAHEVASHKGMYDGKAMLEEIEKVEAVVR